MGEKKLQKKIVIRAVKVLQIDGQMDLLVFIALLVDYVLVENLDGQTGSLCALGSLCRSTARVGQSHGLWCSLVDTSGSTTARGK